MLIRISFLKIELRVTNLFWHLVLTAKEINELIDQRYEHNDFDVQSDNGEDFSIEKLNKKKAIKPSNPSIFFKPLDTMGKFSVFIS